MDKLLISIMLLAFAGNLASGKPVVMKQQQQPAAGAPLQPLAMSDYGNSTGDMRLVVLDTEFVSDDVNVSNQQPGGPVILNNEQKLVNSKDGSTLPPVRTANLVGSVDSTADNVPIKNSASSIAVNGSLLMACLAFLSILVT